MYNFVSFNWLPNNSNFQLVVAVNSVEVKVAKPVCLLRYVTDENHEENPMTQISARMRYLSRSLYGLRLVRSPALA